MEDFKFFSSPNNFLIATGNSSPDNIDLSNFKISFPIFLIVNKGSTTSDLAVLNIFCIIN